MPPDAVPPPQDLAAAVVNERDPQKIIDLIEQLDRDLAETQKNTCQQR